MQRQVRDAQQRDGRACGELYASYVGDTAITFELEPPSAAQMSARIAEAQRRHAWLVLTEADRVVGYAYGGEYKARPAYRWACEVSIYLERDLRRSGGGRQLYDVLLPRLAARGYRTAVAGMTLPNPASEGLHRSLGFEPVGTYRRIGWKLERWHDVLWMQRALGVDEDPPVEPV